MIPQACLGDSVCGQSLRQQSLLITFFKRLHRRTRKPLRLAQMPLSQEGACASVVYLSKVNTIIDLKEKLSRAVEMPVRFGVPAEGEEKEAEIVFTASLITSMPGLLKMK